MPSKKVSKKKKVAKASLKKSAPKKLPIQKSSQLELYAQNQRLKKELDRQQKAIEELVDRLGDAEIHIHLITRLVTTLCIEKMGMRVGVLKRLLKRIENEAIRESQIHHLESLYNRSGTKKRKSSKKEDKEDKKGDDPWEDIS